MVAVSQFKNREIGDMESRIEDISRQSGVASRN